MTEEEPTPERPSLLVSYRWPIVVLAVCLMALMAWWLLLRETRRTARDTAAQLGKGLEQVARRTAAIAAKFKQGAITTTFVAAIPEISSVGMGNLELATATTTEAFRKEDSLSIFWDKIPLGTTVAEIKAPVTYRYHLRLADAWRLDVSNQTCIVYAPPVRPSLPPAIHTDRMEKRSESGWARLNKDEQMAALEKSITPTLATYAGDPRHLALVRETCRQTVAEFIRAWLLKERHWRDDRFHAIKVIFADEANASPERMEPVLRLKD